MLAGPLISGLVVIGLSPEVIEGDWRGGASPEAIHEALKADTGHEIKAVCVVHNETSTGCTSRIADVRKAIDDAGHPALLMVDSISGLASADFRMDDWRVDLAETGLFVDPTDALLSSLERMFGSKVCELH